MMLAHARDPLRLIPVWIALLAVVSVLDATPSRAWPPTAAEPGWTVRAFVEGLYCVTCDVAGDEVSGDLFVADVPVYPPVPVTIYRISRDGTRTAFFTNDQVWANFMEFDPAARLLYAMSGAHVDVITEAGAWVEHDSIPDFARIRGTVLGPDGTLYLLDAQNLRIVRYDRATHTFPTVTTLGALAGSEIGELEMDAGGNFYIMANYYNVVRVTPSGEISYGAGTECVGVEGLAFYGSDLILGRFTELYRLPGALGAGTLFGDGIPVVQHIRVVQDRIYVRDARQNFGTVWEYVPAGPTSVRNATWGRLKSLYR